MVFRIFFWTRSWSLQWWRDIVVLRETSQLESDRRAIDHPLTAKPNFFFHFSYLHRGSILTSGTLFSTYPVPPQVGQSFQKISKPTRQWTLPPLHPWFGQGTNLDIFFLYYLFIYKVCVLNWSYNHLKFSF